MRRDINPKERLRAAVVLERLNNQFRRYRHLAETAGNARLNKKDHLESRSCTGLDVKTLGCS